MPQNRRVERVTVAGDPVCLAVGDPSMRTGNGPLTSSSPARVIVVVI